MGRRLAQEGQEGTGGRSSSWGAAAVAAGLMLLLSYLAFVLIPNTLMGYLTTRMTPVGRDLVVTGVWALSFVLLCGVFVRLQRRGTA